MSVTTRAIPMPVQVTECSVVGCLLVEIYAPVPIAAITVTMPCDSRNEDVVWPCGGPSYRSRASDRPTIMTPATIEARPPTNVIARMRCSSRVNDQTGRSPCFGSPSSPTLRAQGAAGRLVAADENPGGNGRAGLVGTGAALVIAAGPRSCAVV